MAAKKRGHDDVVIAFATQGGLLAALLVLLIGALADMRAWIVLVRAATAFLLVSAILRLVSAACLQLIRRAEIVSRTVPPVSPEP